MFLHIKRLIKQELQQLYYDSAMFKHHQSDNYPATWHILQSKLNNWVKFSLFCLCLCACINVLALPSDRWQKMQLSASAAKLNIATGKSIYKGDVRIVQGTTLLLADVLTLYTNKKNELIQAVAQGKPARYRTLPKPGKAEFHAEADTIEYYPQQNLVILLGNAIAQQENNTYRGPRIEYNTELQTVVSPESAKGRTTIIITNMPIR